jgi:hypothetical protein
MTFHVLKSVYFGCMEFKTIVYIVVGLIWVFSKMLNTKQNKKSLPPYQPATEVPPEIIKPEKTMTEGGRRKNFSGRTTHSPRKPVNRAVSLESDVGLESTVVKYRSYEKIETEAGLQFMGEVQVLQDSDGQENESYGAEIANEIKYGKMDWKRAVVINELLTPRH